MLVSGGGVIQKKTARMRHDESRVSIRDTFWASHFLPLVFLPPQSLRRAGLNAPTSLWRGEGHRVGGCPRLGISRGGENDRGGGRREK